MTVAAEATVADVDAYLPAVSSMVPLVPARLLESRADAAPTIDGQFSGIGVRAAGSVTELVVAGRGGVPADASAVVLNVTVTGAQDPGFVTVWPCGTAMPTASNLNYDTGWTIPNAVVAKIGAGGKVCLFTMARTHLIADVNAYFPAVSSMVPLVPARLLESRADAAPTIDGQFSGIGVRAAGSVTELVVAGRGGVPADASAVVLNVTVTGAQDPGFVTVWPCGTAMPTASNLNYDTGWTIPNAVVAKIGAGGKVCLFTMARTHLIADVNAYFPAVSSMGSTVSLVPARLLESRSGVGGTVDWKFTGIGVRAAGSVTELVVAGRGGVPADASAVVLNVTVTGAQDPGFVTVWPCGTAMPTASNLNYDTGWTIPNAVVAKIGAGGKVCLFTMARTHLIADVNAYFPAVSPWNDICYPMATTYDPGDWVPDVALGSTVDLTGYLEIFGYLSQGTAYPFHFRSIAYSTGVTSTPQWKCDLTVWITVGMGANQVQPLSTGSFTDADVRVRDSGGAVYTGTALLTANARVVGVGTSEYGADNGLPGTNTVTLQSLHVAG